MPEPVTVARIDGWYLQRLAEGPFVRSYRIVKDAEGYGLMESTIITEACGYLTLSGDCTPTVGGVSTPLRYGLDWFAKASTPSYLGQKFLRLGYCPWERAKITIQRWVDQADDHGLNEEQVERLQDLLDSSGSDLDEFGIRLYDALNDIDPYLVDDGPPGSGYHPGQLEHLCEIQARFSKLWATRDCTNGQTHAVADLETKERLHERLHALTELEHRLLMVLAKSDSPEGMSCLEMASALQRSERSIRRRRRTLLNYGLIYIETTATCEPGGMVMTTFGRRAAELLLTGASATRRAVNDVKVGSPEAGAMGAACGPSKGGARC